MLTLEQAMQFQSALDEKALILTPNHQLAVALHDTLGALRRKQGRPTVSISPHIYAIDMWTRKVWQSLVVNVAHDQAHWQLLTSSHEQLIWYDIISNSRDASTLLNPGDCVRAASRAATLMKQHFLTQDDIADWLNKNWPTPEERLDLSDFIKWYKQYEAVKLQNELLSLSDLVEIVTSLVRSKKISLPGQVVTFGFSEPPPLYKNLLDTLSRFSSVSHLQTEKLSPDISLLECDSASHEIYEAAQWADNILTNSPDARIAIVSPDMTSRQESIVRTFGHFDKLASTALRVRESINQELFIQGTLALLKLNRVQLNTLELCGLLRSPLIASPESELSARAALEMQLRKFGEYDVTPAHLRYLCHQQERPYFCPDLGYRLQEFAELARTLSNRTLSPTECLTVFQQQLQKLGWPGDRPLNNAEVHALDVWQKLQDQFLSLAAFKKSMSLPEATNCLEDLAGCHQYAPSQLTSRISILSAEEAEHLQFTHIWIMGVNEHLWPAESKANPLLPFSLQREFGLPGTDRNRHYDFYETLLNRLSKNATSEVCVSYARQQEELEARPSPALELIKASPKQLTQDKACQFAPPVNKLRRAAEPEHVVSPASLALSGSEQPGGGKTLLQNQSQCPFRSFAIHRLNATELPSPTYGLNPMVLGNLLHMVLENVWRELGTYKALLHLTEDDRTCLAANCSKQAVQRLAKRHPQLMQRQFRRLEEERLKGLVIDWLTTEQEREFLEVAKLEEEFVWTYKSLTLKLKADRIDRNNQHKLEVIDYKSGRPLSITWDDDRPEHPQLMLYLLAVEERYGKDTVSALLHAYVSVGNFSFQYINQGQTGTIPASTRSGPEFDWAEIKTLWQQSLESLADEFIAGLHSVTPRNRTFCHSCHIKPFCRIELNPAYLPASGNSASPGGEA